MTVAKDSATTLGWTILAGCWWAAAETMLGSALHLAASPQAGLVMGLIGLGTTVAIARYAGGKGIVAGAAAIAVAAKLSATGALGLSPAIAIAATGLVAEFGLRRSGPLLAMTLAGTVEAIHPWIFGRFVTGRSWEAILLRAGDLGIGSAIPALLSAIVLKLGVFAFAGYAIGRALKR